MLALLATSFWVYQAAVMFRQIYASFLEWDPSRLSSRIGPLILATLAVLLLVTADADARRRYYRHRQSEYSPPFSAMAIDVYTGRVLYSKNADEPRYPASLTKVMTLICFSMRSGTAKLA